MALKRFWIEEAKEAVLKSVLFKDINISIYSYAISKSCICRFIYLRPNDSSKGKQLFTSAKTEEEQVEEATVRLFAEHKAFVVAADIQDEFGHQLAASMPSNSVAYHHCDETDESQVEETINFTLQKHNAGTLGPLSAILDLREFDATMAVNLRGIVATIKQAAHAMIGNNVRGSIICTTSLAASMGGSDPQAYTTSKHSLLGLVRSVCRELDANGIRVNCVPHFF